MGISLPNLMAPRRRAAVPAWTLAAANARVNAWVTARVNARRIVLLAAFAVAGPAPAGEHFEIALGEEGRADALFISTEAERRWYGVSIALRDYRAQDDTVLLSAWPSFGFTACHNQPMRVFSPEGHGLEVPSSPDHLACIGRVPAAWLRAGFGVRVPMFNARPRYARLDVSALDLQRLRLPQDDRERPERGADRGDPAAIPQRTPLN